MVSILILTKNEQQDLPGCLESVKWSNDIHVLDSYSIDETIDIAKAYGASVTQRNFDDWSSHQNWALQNIIFKNPWVFYLDADERISDILVQNLLRIPEVEDEVVAFEIQRRDFAWDGTWLKHSQISSYYLRLFKPSKMRYDRIVNPVSIVDGKTRRISGYLDHYPFSKGFKAWWTRHLSYADLEAEMRIKDAKQGVRFSFKKALFSKNLTEKRFHQKGLFYKLPARPLIKWLYMIFFRFAFLDGRVGLQYAALQSVYEYFIVLKTNELTSVQKKTN